MIKATIVVALAAIAVLKLTYFAFVRPRVLNWHVEGDEATRAMAGDDILPDANLQTTRAITIGAPPSDIWPWLMQMGPRPRGGAYTYDWIERMLGIDIENSDDIMPEYQHLVAGEFLGLDEHGKGLQVREVIDQRALVVQWIPALSTWTFGLYPGGDGTTRFISRNRIRVGSLPERIGMFIMEPASLVMERKMLIGIKERAERLHRGRASAAPLHQPAQ